MAYFRNLFGTQPCPRFWVKTFLHLLTPGGFGYIRKLRAGRDKSYVHERDKHAVRYKHHGGGGWKSGKDGGLGKRDYANYEECLSTHQKLKLDEMVKMKGGFGDLDIFDYQSDLLLARYPVRSQSCFPSSSENPLLRSTARRQGRCVARPGSPTPVALGSTKAAAIRYVDCRRHDEAG